MKSRGRDTIYNHKLPAHRHRVLLLSAQLWGRTRYQISTPLFATKGHGPQSPQSDRLMRHFRRTSSGSHSDRFTSHDLAQPRTASTDGLPQHASNMDPAPHPRDNML
ncbi:unnamed protein product [Mortierella alpina]